ncbi:hypothetical protein GLOTRDRAFT_132096 [Gloeophyllum trabeum ATCC 11539]|uniref:Uncharacterized protein n=1 Tax=Gloeophyllum trabeum (strain ATCC 11539 / FP-39264 / Madison 617) TaxID=670483 RepID=S7PZF7_GLOTA|nr:uncharacterized protein GLOTRDRAFT_132096 [Gloeophyllum trabeum ATCC 11539]EPQ52863.1 hypothetical protein GLOTRDRAFT_132096 [Gloeophyllum trabeum ATCC 11539]
MSYLNNVASEPEDRHVVHPRDRDERRTGSQINVEAPVVPSDSGHFISEGADSREGFEARQARGEFADGGESGTNLSYGQGQQENAETPGLGQRMKGSLEKVAGKAMRDPGLVEKGEALKTNQPGNNM